MIIGNKNVFAVELFKDMDDPKMGYGKLWIQDIFLGTKEDLIFLNGYLIGLLDEIINSQSLEVNIDQKDKKQIFDLIKSTEKERSKYTVIGSTFTDDFEIYSFEKENHIFLLWQLRNDIKMIFDELKNYSREIHFAKVSKSEIQVVKEKVLKEIM